jgi:hypothetical protein
VTFLREESLLASTQYFFWGSQPTMTDLARGPTYVTYGAIRRYTYAQLIISSLTTSARYKSVSRRERTHRDGGAAAVQRVVEAWRDEARRK